MIIEEILSLPFNKDPYSNIDLINYSIKKEEDEINLDNEVSFS